MRYVPSVISIRIHFHGAIDRRGLNQDHVTSCPAGTTIADLLLRLGYPALQIKSILPIMDGKRMPMSFPLRDGDALDLLAPAGGG